MPLKVMLSSVRRGLADVRDAIDPVIKILRYDVIRYETVTKTPVPARATCVAMVEASDIYLLLLGDQYGDPVPGTGLAPTEEEWTVARNLGKPTVVFKRSDMTPEPRQDEFIRKVESYETGVWRHLFADTGHLISQLEAALATAATLLRSPAPSALEAPVSVPWRTRGRGIYSGAGTILETHLIPLGARPALPAASLGDLARTTARAAEEHGLFTLGQALQFQTTETSVTVEARREGQQTDAGIAVGRDGSVSIWEGLPRSFVGGALLDEAQFARQIARDLRLATSLALARTEQTAIAVGIDDVAMLGVPSGSAVSLPFASSGGRPMQLEPSDSWPTLGLAAAADDIAEELVARLMLRLGAHR